MQAHFENQLMPSYDKTYWQAWLTCTNKTATQSNSTSNTWPAISLDSSQSGVPNSTGTLSHLDPGFSVTALRGTVHPWFHPLPVGLGTSRVSFTVSKKSCRVQFTLPSPFIYTSCKWQESVGAMQQENSFCTSLVPVLFRMCPTNSEIRTWFLFSRVWRSLTKS